VSSAVLPPAVVLNLVPAIDPYFLMLSPLDNSFVNDTLADTNYLLEQRHALALADKGLIYQSAPFAEDTEVTGQLKLRA